MMSIVDTKKKYRAHKMKYNNIMYKIILNYSDLYKI